MASIFPLRRRLRTVSYPLRDVRMLRSPVLGGVIAFGQDVPTCCRSSGRALRRARATLSVGDSIRFGKRHDATF
jgi:hypothetical protein